MKKQFEAHGISLLTPEEYLDTPEKKKLFDETEFEHSKTWKAVGAISARIRGSIVGDVKAQPEGMKYIYTLVPDAKVWRAVGKFAGDLGLDALAPFGPLKGYLEGLIYVNHGGTGPKGSVLLAKHKKGKLGDQYFDNVGKLYGRVIGKALEEFKVEREKITTRLDKGSK